MKPNHSDDLQSVVNQLVALERFSPAEARERCSSASAGEVTRTLQGLVRAGLLKTTSSGDQLFYRWHGQRDPERAVRAMVAKVRRTLPLEPGSHSPHPAERLVSEGAGALSNVELLAILLRGGIKLEEAMRAARSIADRFAGRMDELSRFGPEEFRKFGALTTQNGYVQVMAGIELGRRITISHQRGPLVRKINSTQQAVAFCRDHFLQLAWDGQQEEFHIVTLDTKHKPITTHRITVGTLDASLVHPREVFRPAIRDAAAAILLVHNHPSGESTPSDEDHSVTDQLTRAGELLGIAVLDHIVVAREGCASVREAG